MGLDSTILAAVAAVVSTLVIPFAKFVLEWWEERGKQKSDIEVRQRPDGSKEYIVSITEDLSIEQLDQVRKDLQLLVRDDPHKKPVSI